MPEPTPQTGVRAPVGVDPTRASIARVYDATLGGKDNYDVDRFVRDKVAEIAPRQSDVARMNRRWLHRVVRYLSGTVGIDQFLDIGAGLPTVGNTHEIVQQQNPDAKVVYVDNDPVCNAHGRVLLETNENTHFVPADLTQPDTLLSHAEVTKHLDLSRPIGVVLCGILHHVDDDLDPAAIMQRYVDRLAPGSYIGITHFWDPGAESDEAHQMALELQRRFTEMGLGSGWYRSRAEITSLFGDLNILEPGVVELDDWWPSGPSVHQRSTDERLILGGLGYKPDNAGGDGVVTPLHRSNSTTK
ncbi:SAM-dependent methyltransferase [Nocardia callitridis]|uniref:SAM-dependent methyltransferase n=1 Tax=Nocardia callitridis TaxID=648753 RepID=A0ABP9KRP0_9NOCA